MRILLGELPEIINEILQYLDDDYSTLYSCILVNRLWCRLAIPLLWKDPFSISQYRKHLKHHFLDFYLYFFDEDDKVMLRDVFGIDRIDSISSPLFDYPHFIKALSTYKLDLIVSDWIDSFTEQLSKLHRKKGNSLYYNLPQTVMMHSLHLQSIRQRSLSNNNEKSSSEFSSRKSNIRRDFQNKILPSPSRSNVFQKKRREIYNLPNSLPYPLPVDFKYLKRETETPSKRISINANLNSLNIISQAISTALTPVQIWPRRRTRHRLLAIPSSMSMAQFLQDEKFEKPMKLKRFICCALIKSFISYSASLITFEIILHHKTNKYSYNVMYDVYEMIRNNPEFICDVENFTFHYSLPNNYILPNRNTESKIESLLPLISCLPSSCNLIKNLKFQVIPNFNVEASKSLAKLISSQRQLSKLTFAFNKEILQDSLSIFKDVAHTLTCLIFDSCQFVNNVLQPFQSFQGLEYLENLESLQFFNCYPVLKSEIVQHISNIRNLKIKTLAIVNSISRGEVSKILQYRSLLLKIGTNLENLILSIDFDIKEDIFKVILHYCEKIKFIHFTKLNHDSIPELNNLVKYFGKTLRYITLDIDNEIYARTFRSLEDDLGQNMNKTSTILLQQLGQVLPSTLEYIDLFLTCDPVNLKIFLDNCKHIKLKRLLLRNSREFYLDHTLQLLKNFVMEISSMQYLAYRIGKGTDFFEWDLGGNELKEKERAKEFEPYVKVRKYSDVVIRMSEPFYNGSIAAYTL